MFLFKNIIKKRSGSFLQLLFLFLIIGSSSFIRAQLTQVDDFGENKGNLKMYYYQPKTLSDTTKVPLVLVLHGCTQSADKISDASGWNKLADSLHFVVVYPEQRMINNAGKCFNFFLGFKAKKDKGEVLSIKEMIDYSIKNFNVDSNYICITGMSAGGAMTNALLNAYPETFKAGAILAAPSTVFDLDSTNTHHYPKVAVIQGEDDLVVPPKNADEIVQQWVHKHQLDTNNSKLISNYMGIDVLYAQYFYDATEKLKIVLLKSKKVKHKLLITEGDAIHQGGRHDFHTDDVGFHSTYWIASFFDLTKSSIYIPKESN